MKKGFMSGALAWFEKMKSDSGKFIAVLLFAYLLLGVSLVYKWPVFVVFAAMVVTLAIPFLLVVMWLTQNPVYEALNAKPWGKAALAIIVMIYCYFSYTWAATEVGGIFSTANSNLPWATAVLTVVYFFKNVVLVLAGLFLMAVLCLSTWWVADVLVINYKSLGDFARRVKSGVALVLSIGLTLGAAGFVTAHGTRIAKMVAVNADFSSKHRCAGEFFEDSDGVLFLPSGKVLVAKRQESSKADWQFPAYDCVIQN